jgi:germination protein YpeB
LRSKSLLIGLLISIGLVAGAIWFTQVNNRASVSQNVLEASYQNNFFSLLENLENLDVLLGKILASNSADQDIITFATAWSMAEVAKANLGNLPLGTVNTMRSNQYLAQLGDFSYSLAQKLAGNQKITEAEWNTVRQLHQETRAIHNELRGLLVLMQEKQLRFGSLTSLKGDLAFTPANREMLDSFGQLDERLQNEVPTLTYDGPFSDHVVNRAPRGLVGRKISEKEAESIALEFVKNRNKKYTAKSAGLAAGRIPAYSVLLQPEEKGQSNLIFGISQTGGHVVFMMDARETARVSIVEKEQAFQKAEEFMQELSLGRFLPIGHLIEGNELLVNFALLQDEVIIYPDMIQVIVSLESGNIVAYDASKFLHSHTHRELPAPKITEAQAREKVNKNLKIEQVRLALIPLGNLEEQLTYEIKGKIDQDTYYVYINAQTGLQEKILLILETPQGSRSI